VTVPATLILPLKDALAAVIEATVMFGVPLNPVAFPVTLPTKPPEEVVTPN